MLARLCDAAILQNYPSFQRQQAQAAPFSVNRFIFLWNQRGHEKLKRSRFKRCLTSAVVDPELHKVLELASDNELTELSEILYGRSLFSPVFKSVAPGDGSAVTSSFGMHEDADEDREEMLDRLESRLLFLAADARSTVTGRRPRYRDVLLQVRKKLQIRCSTKLATEDLESEIFLFLLQEYSSRQKLLVRYRTTENADLEVSRVASWKESVVAAFRLGGNELMTAIVKGGSALTISTFQRLLSKEISARMLTESARYHLAKESLKKGGHLVATRLESYVALLTARQVLSGAATRYLTIRSTMVVLGPVLWGTFLADVVLTALGTDYARVVRAIYALAQIRLTRTYGWTKESNQEDGSVDDA